MGAGSNWIDPKYDAAGNLIEGPKPAAETTRHKYVYDAWNRLVAVKDNADATLATFAYDALGRRIQKVDVAANPDVTYDYYFNEAWQVVEVRKNGSANPLEQFAWHAYYIDAPLVRFYDSNTDGAGVVEHYYGHDAQFNVTVVHDISASVLERYDYTPYGELTVLDSNFAEDANGTDYENTTTYTGRSLDLDTGLYYFRNRDYGAGLGRFCQRDPIGYADGLNLYAGYFVPNGLDAFGLDQHHWFPQFGQGANRKGQEMVNGRCPELGLNIDDFTTYFPGVDVGGLRNSPHSWLTHTYRYNDQYMQIYQNARDCCDFLTGVFALMNLSIEALNERNFQFLPPGGAWDLGGDRLEYHEPMFRLALRPWHGRARDTMPELLAAISKACNRDNDRIRRQIHDYQDKFRHVDRHRGVRPTERPYDDGPMRPTFDEVKLFGGAGVLNAILHRNRLKSEMPMHQQNHNELPLNQRPTEIPRPGSRPITSQPGIAG